jgi:hypothetical protein
MVISPDVASLGLEPDTFVAAAHEHWGDRVGVTGRTGPEIEVELEVVLEADDQHPAPFRVCLAHAGASVFTDGNWEQAADMAAWLRTLVPEDFAYRLWLVDHAFSGHAMLPPGVHADQLADLWLEHAKDGFPPLPEH